MISILAYNKTFKLASSEATRDKELLFKDKEFSFFIGDKEYLEFSELSLTDHEKFLMLKSLCQFFPLFGREDLSQFLPEFLWPSHIKIGKSATFYGGSFNPWHEGHSECVRQYLEIDSDLIIIPDNNPWKESQRLKNLDELLAISKATDRKCIIYPEFWLHDKKNPTCEWLTRVGIVNKRLLMGDDTFSSFYKWQDVEKVIAEIDKIYVIPRSEGSSVKTLELLDKRVDVIDLHSHKFMDLSSTNIRKEKDKEKR